MALKKITILYPFQGKTFGGGHVSIISMLKLLDKKRFKPIILIHEKGILKKILEQENINYITETKIKIVKSNSIKDFFFNSMKNFLRIRKLLNEEKIDIIHCNDGRMHATWNIPTLLSGRKFIWHMRSRDDSRRLVFYSVFANKILSISNYCKKNLPPILNKRVKVVKNFFSFSIPKVFPQKNKKKIISYVANFKAQKRPELFFEIANAILNSGRKDINFHIFGIYSLNEQNELMKIIHNRVHKKKINFMGHKFPIGPWIRKSILTVSLGHNEGFGRVLIESMLNKSLVIATSGGGHDEIIRNGKNGIIIESNDTKLIARKILFYIKNKAVTKKITDNAFIYSNKNFVKNNTPKHIEKIYETIL